MSMEERREKDSTEAAIHLLFQNDDEDPRKGSVEPKFEIFSRKIDNPLTKSAPTTPTEEVKRGTDKDRLDVRPLLPPRAKSSNAVPKQLTKPKLPPRKKQPKKKSLYGRDEEAPIARYELSKPSTIKAIKAPPPPPPKLKKPNSKDESMLQHQKESSTSLRLLNTGTRSMRKGTQSRRRYSNVSIASNSSLPSNYRASNRRVAAPPIRVSSDQFAPEEVKEGPWSKKQPIGHSKRFPARTQTMATLKEEKKDDVTSVKDMKSVKSTRSKGSVRSRFRRGKNRTKKKTGKRKNLFGL